MSDFEKELDRIQQELRSLARDIEPGAMGDGASWKSLVPASHTLGRKIRVTRLDLAAEFLGVLCERDQLLKRIAVQRASGIPEGVFDEEVESLARRLEDDQDLVAMLEKHLREAGTLRLRGRMLEYQDLPPMEEGEDDESDLLADQLLHETVEAERDRLLVQKFQGREGFDSKQEPLELETLVIDGSEILQESMMKGLSSGDLKILQTWLKAYRRSTLHYSWLSPEEDTANPIQHLFTLMKTNGNFSFNRLTQLSNDPEYADLGEETYGIWEQLAELFGQLDFDDIIEDLDGGFLPTGPDWDDRINILPGEGDDACKPVLLAFARGGGSRGKFAFENVMKSVKQHLIDCQDIVKLVVFVTDTWDSRKFMSDHYGELSSWRRKDGVRFLFLGVGAPRDQIAPIAVDLT